MIATKIFVLLATAAFAADPSVAELEKQARAGDVEVQFRLGFMYKDGDGAPKDAAKSQAWFKSTAQSYQKSAAKGDGAAIVNLGSMYYEGYGLPQSYAKAAEWFRKGANLGIPAAQDNLAEMHADRLIKPADLVEAQMWLFLAATAGEDDHHREVQAKVRLTKDQRQAAYQKARMKARITRQPLR